MQKEDPLERLERREQEKKQNGPFKAVMIVMIVVAVLLAAALVYVMQTKNQLVDQLNIEKEDLTEQIARLYLTHPGVTADGIMTKMGY